MNSNKKGKKLLIVSSVLFVTIFLVVFLINYSFAGVKSHRLNIPRSTCEEKSLPLTEQSSNCEERKFFENLAKDYSLEDIYDVWGAFNDEQQEVVLEYLQNNDMVKYTELDNLIRNINAKKMTESVDGNEVTVITEIPRNTSIEVVKTDKEKINIIEDIDIGIVNNDSYIESYTYDISMNNNKTNYVNNDALITISDIKANDNKKYYVYHLLDSVEAINAYKDNTNLLTIDSDKLTGDFSEELKAAKEYSNVDNRIYVLLEEANINNDGSISFTTNSFSTFHVVGYTVDFHYDGMTYSINGETSVLLSQVFEKLKIDKDVSKIVSVTFTDEELVKVTKTENDWILTSLKAFDTDETLTMFFEDGEMFTLDVSDMQQKFLFNEDQRNNYFSLGAYYWIDEMLGQNSKIDFRVHILNDSSGSTSPVDRPGAGSTAFTYSVDKLRLNGVQFHLASDKYWFYVRKGGGTGSLTDGDNGINDVDFKGTSQFDPLKYDIYALPRVTISDTYCTIFQGTAQVNNAYKTGTVRLFINDWNSTSVDSWTGIFPHRDNGLGDFNTYYNGFLFGNVNNGNYDGGLTVRFTEEQNQKYYFNNNDKTYGSNRRYNDGELQVLLKSKFKIHFDKNDDNATGTMSDQEVIYGDGQNLKSNTFTKPYYHLTFWSTTPTITMDTNLFFQDQEDISKYTDVAGDVINLYAIWGGDLVNYKVYEYTQDIPVEGQPITYTKIEKDPFYETKNGNVGEYTRASSNPPTGFDDVVVENKIVEPNIVVDGETQYTTIEIKYPRKQFTTTIYHKDIDSNNNPNTLYEDSVSKYYQENLDVSNYIKDNIVGYKYISSDQDNINVTEDSSTNIYYQYTEVPYTVNYYQKDIGSNTYTKVSSDSYTVNGKLHDNITYNTKTYTGFKTIPEKVEYIDTNNNIYTDTKVEENLKEVNIYYDRYIFTIEYSYSGTVPANAPEVPTDNAVEYGKTITLPVISLEGYDFSWDKASPLTVTSNMNVVGTFTPKNNAFYRVRYYLKGTTTEIKPLDENLNAEYNKEYSIEAPEITGYTLDDTSPKTVVAGYAGSNNEIHFEYRASTVNYTVNYCLENINGNGCTNQTETLQGKPLDPISYEQKNIEGFTFDRVENNSNDVINPDGSTIVIAYYTRNSHNLIYCITKDDDDTYRNCQSINYKYEEEIQTLTTPSENYYNFSGWIVETPGVNIIPSTMPDHDINVSGVLIRKTENLTIISKWSDNSTGKVSSFTIMDSDNNTIHVVTDSTGKVVVNELSVGKTYTIIETSCDIGYTCDNFIVHEMIEGTNIVTFNNNLNNDKNGWLKSTTRNKNTFGEIQ